MALNYKSRYPAQTDTDAQKYPYGKARNISTPVSEDGTPWERDLINDQWGFLQAMLTSAGIVPNGTPDSADSSQYLDAMGTVNRDKLALKVFTSPTNSSTTLVETFTKKADTVYEVRNASDDSLATIYSDPEATSSITQNSVGNKSNSKGEVIFYITGGDYYIREGATRKYFNVVTCSREFINVTDMIRSNPLLNNEVVSTGATKWRVSNSAGLPLDGGLFALPLNGVWVEDFQEVEDNEDASLYLQRAIQAVELIGKVLTLKSNKNHILKTLNTVPLTGDLVGLVVNKPRLVRWSFGGNRIIFDTTSLYLQSQDKKALIALNPDEYTYYDISMRDVEFNGGLWTNPAHRPENVLKADYRQIAYSKFEDIKLSFAKGDVWVSHGFVIKMEKVRARFAGTQGSGFLLKAPSSGAANTGYHLDTCTADYAGLHGFRVEGASGHTYCKFTNCHADFIGQDDSRGTIVANIGSAYAYSLSNVRVVGLDSCGAEYCTAVLELENARTVNTHGIYSYKCGSGDLISNTVDSLYKISGFYERVKLAQCEDRDTIGTITDRVVISNPSQFNANHIEYDDTFRQSNFRFDGGNSSSGTLPLVSGDDLLYFSTGRRGAGNVVKTGGRFLGTTNSNWLGDNEIAEQTFYKQVNDSPSVINLFTVSSTPVDRSMGWVVEITQTRGTVAAISKYIGSVHVKEGVYSVTQPSDDGLGVSGTLPVISEAGGIVSLSLPLTYTGYYIKVTSTGWGVADTVKFDWY